MKPWRLKDPHLVWLIALLIICASGLPFLLAIFELFQNTKLEAIADRLTAQDLQTMVLFTIVQSSATTALVVFLSPIFALGLSFLPTTWRRLTIILRTSFFCLPSVVVASGLVIAWGHSGFFTKSLLFFGLSIPFAAALYSPYAIIFANTLMCIPFCTVVIFDRMLTIPESHFKSAAMLGLSPLRTIKLAVWPAAKPTLIYFAGLAFLLSMGSFGALSILGGGPKSRTVELGIYQAVYYTADWELASVLALLHTVACGGVAFACVSWYSRSLLGKRGPRAPSANIDALRSVIGDIGKPFVAFLVLATIMLDALALSPVASIFVQTAFNILGHQPLTETTTISDAALVSISFAAPAAIMATIVMWSLSRAYFRYASHKQKKKALMLQMISISSAIIPPMALAFGILVAQSHLDTQALRQPALVVGLIATTLPYLLSWFLPVYESHLKGSERSRLWLGISEWIFLKNVEWPALKASAWGAFALCLALCMNESSMVTLLGDPINPALTTTMMRLMNHYRFTDSSVIACLLILVTFAVVLMTSKMETR